uniref:Uncharacterized protein n=1 Tax=Arundo donax TaxID=35708 RepID=A0A0A8ZBX8_ARUDO
MAASYDSKKQHASMRERRV